MEGGREGEEGGWVRGGIVREGRKEGKGEEESCLVHDSGEAKTGGAMLN